MISTMATSGIELVATNIPGFDLLAVGGLPRHRTALIVGTAGSGKTVFATQFLIEGVRQSNTPGVFVTLEESPQDIRNNMRSLGCDIAAMEADAQWMFVDATPSIAQEDVLIGDYDLGGLLARIQAAVSRIGATRVVIDAIGTLVLRLGDPGKIRSELYRISRTLDNLRVTSLMTGEQTSDYGEIGRYGAEEFAVDSVIVMRNALEGELRRRTIEILKMRGVPHRRGEFPFVIVDGAGIEVVPLSAISLEHKSTPARIPFGNPGLDLMCAGGPFRDSTILVSGPTGAGKTLMAAEFAVGAAQRGERCLFLGFEESREQLFRNANGWGHDFSGMEEAGLLRVSCEYPESRNLEDRLVYIKKNIIEFRPQRIALDSLGALGRLATIRTMRDFVLGLTAFVKHYQICTLFTTAVEHVVGATTVTESRLTEFTDAIFLLRYVEMHSSMRHGVMVLKMRGSRHDTAIREFTIDDQGMHVGAPFHGAPADGKEARA